MSRPLFNTVTLISKLAHRRMRLRALVIATVLTAAAITGLSVSARRNQVASPTETIALVAAPALMTAILPAPVAEQDRNQEERIEAEVLEIQPNGFEPAQISRPRGRIILSVNNRTGLDDLDLELTTSDGHKVSKIKLKRKKPQWSELVDLPAGSYTLREASHPEWVCQFSISR